MSDTLIFSSVRSPCASGKEPATEEADVSPPGRLQSRYALHFLFSARVVHVGPLQFGISCGSGSIPGRCGALGGVKGLPVSSAVDFLLCCEGFCDVLCVFCHPSRAVPRLISSVIPCLLLSWSTTGSTFYPYSTSLAFTSGGSVGWLRSIFELPRVLGAALLPQVRKIRRLQEIPVPMV